MIQNKKLDIIVGTRPNFIKVTQFKKIAESSYPELEIKIIHTGQHSDDKMSKVFFSQFNLVPDTVIELKTKTANSQIAEIMLQLEAVLSKDRPDYVMVVGDVNSTLAGALVANKMNILLIHLESGLRSFDRTMPEETNRIITDQLADHLFVTEQSGIDNLLKEGKQKAQIHFVGNTMIDTMLSFENEIDENRILHKLQLKSGGFALMTIHRPATVDNREGLLQLFELLKKLKNMTKIVFPIHPRTKKNIALFGFEKELNEMKNVVLTDPLDYFAFQKLIKECLFVLTDSGGIQEEATQGGVPCLTLRSNTERPITVLEGTNTLIPFEIESVIQYVESIKNGSYKKGAIPTGWDGKATERVVKIISEL